MKKDWELNRLKALKEEEEKRAELEEDEMLYTYSRDDAYQQVKKRNKMLALEAKKMASEARNLTTVLSPRKAASLGLENGGEGDGKGKKRWVYKTPKIIKDLVRNRNLPEGVMAEEKMKRKSKVKIRVDDDSNEDIDVETVDAVEETAGKQKVRKKLDKPVVKRPRKSKGDTPVKSRKMGISTAVCSTEATKLDSLPGFSMPTLRDGIFDKLHSPSKGTTSRANIFEQFGLQTPPPASLTGISVVQAQGQAPLLQNAIPGGTVRLINTPQGRQMVVVSSSSLQSPQASPQNVVLLQGMQGFPQGIVVGNNIVSLQGTPLNVTPVARATTPVSIQTPRIVGTPQIVSPKFGARIVTPVVGGLQGNPGLVQRFVTGQRVNQNVIPGAAVQVSHQTSPPKSVPQLANIPQLRLSSPLVHTSGGHLVSLQQTPPAPQRKSSVQTIASLIAAGKSAKQIPLQASQLSPATVQQSQAPKPSLVNIPNLASLMRAQIPGTASSSHSSHSVPIPTQSQVRVNPTVAKLVASHIHSVGSNASQTSSSLPVPSTRPSSPAVIHLSSVSRSQSPTVVKVVSVSRTASPTVNVTSTGKPPVGPVPRGENPVATINIKGLPPGVSIPASLVNSLVSGSIGGMAKGTLRGVVPQAAVGTSAPAVPSKTVVRLSQPVAGNSSHNASPSADIPSAQGRTLATENHVASPTSTKLERKIPGKGVTPVTAAASPPTIQAWSNPNLVIRTRRAAAKQSPTAQARVPQAGPSPIAPVPVDGLTGPKANGPSSLTNHVAKNIQQASIPLVVQDFDEKNDSDSAGNNGGVDLIEIS